MAPAPKPSNQRRSSGVSRTAAREFPAVTDKQFPGFVKTDDQQSLQTAAAK